MKALVYHGPGTRSWEDVPDPGVLELGAGLRPFALDRVHAQAEHERDRGSLQRLQPGHRHALRPRFRHVQFHPRHGRL